MARKGGAGLGGGVDIGLLFSNLMLTATLVLAVIGWIVAFVGQIAAEAQNHRQGVLWFNVFLQLFLILAAIYIIATNSVSAASLQISFFLAISIVFSVIGVNQGIYSGQSSREAVTAGWFILAIVNIIWLLYFTSQEDTAIYGILNRFGNGALHGPGGGRSHMGNGGAARMGSSHEGNAYGAGGFITSQQGGSGGYQPAFHSSATDLNPNASKTNGMAAGAGSIRSGNTHPNVAGGYGSRPDIVAASDHGRAASPTSTHNKSAPGTIDGAAGDPTPGYGYRARALYAYQANADDPTEISFSKGEVLDIVDNSGKWWQARKATGETGIVPSNYMQVL